MYVKNKMPINLLAMRTRFTVQGAAYKGHNDTATVPLRNLCTRRERSS
jgi:hypothetical protein